MRRSLWLVVIWMGCFAGPNDAVSPSITTTAEETPVDEGVIPELPRVEAPWFEGLSQYPVLNRVQGNPVEKPGIILLMVDTLRADALGVYGQKAPTSPFLDQLSRNGVVFVNHVSNSTWTRTSVASLLTGKYPNQHGVLELHLGLKRKQITLAERLSAEGFATATVLANPIVGGRYGLTQGYDFVAEPKTHFDNEHPNAKQVFATAKSWLKKNGDDPFFLSLLLFDPHHPYTPAEDQKKRFCPDCDAEAIVHPQREYRGTQPTVKQVADMKGLYHAEVRETDAAIARFFGWLDASGLSERVTTVLVADHGEAFGEHDVFEHAFHPWDEVARTPMVLSGAGVSTRGFVDAPTHHVDVMPTVLRLAGVDVPPESVGTSLIQAPAEPNLDPNRVRISEVEMYGIHRYTVRHQGLKLVRHEPLNEETFLKYYDALDVYPSVARGAGRWELFDTKTDPGEHNNLADPSIAQHPLTEALNQYKSQQAPRTLQHGNPDAALLEDLKAIGYIE